MSALNLFQIAAELSSDRVKTWKVSSMRCYLKFVMHIDPMPSHPRYLGPFLSCLPFLQSAVKRLDDLLKNDGVFRQLSNAPGTLHGAPKLLGE